MPEIQEKSSCFTDCSVFSIMFTNIEQIDKENPFLKNLDKASFETRVLKCMLLILSESII